MEDGDSIHSVIRDKTALSGDLVFVSLTPGASYAFERCATRYRTIMDYCLDDTECHIEGLENCKRIERIVAVLEKEIAPFHKIVTLTPAQYSIYNLKILLDGLWTTILTLKKIIGTEKPDLIRLYTSHLIRSDIGRYAFTNDESMYAEILVMDGWHIPIEIIQNDRVKKESARRTAEKTKLEGSFPAFLKKHDLLFNLGLIWKREGTGAAIKSFLYSLIPRLHKPILIYNSGYNWDDSLIEFYRLGMCPIFRIMDESVKSAYPDFPDYSDEVRSMCTQHPALRGYDRILGIDVSGFFYKRLSQIIGTSIRESTGSYEIIRKMIQTKQIRALLLATRERSVGHAVVQAAHDAGIPVISWQHGGGGYADFLMMPYIEFINSDWHFVFGEKVAEKFTYAAKVCRFDKLPLFFAAGSSSLDHLWRKKNKSRANQEQNKIVYITSDYHRNLYTISYPFNPFFLDEHLWNIQKRIMEMAKNYPDRDFVIKLHPIHIDKEPLKSYVGDHDIHNLTIITSEKTVPELLDSADFVIIDHIATGILQVLTSKVPVFAYTGLFHLDTDAQLMLKKCAYVSDNLDDLFENAEKYILAKTMSDRSISPDNCEFLKNYGTDIHSFNSAEKAAIKLNEIIG